MQKLVVYFHQNPLNDDVFYVGCGLPNRPYTRADRSAEWKMYVKEHGIKVVIYKSGLFRHEANYLEAFFIKLYGRKGLDVNGTLLNKSIYGETHTGCHHNETTKRILSCARKGKPLSESHKAKLTEYHRNNPGSMLGKTHTEAAKLKMSVARKKRITKDETRFKMSLSRQLLNNANSKRVIDTNTGFVFGTMKEAARVYGISLSYLSQMLSGIIKNKTPLRLD